MEQTPLPPPIRPRVLRRGDRLAVVATSSAIDPQQIALGCEIIRSVGLEPVCGPNIRRLRTTGLYAAPLQERLAEIEWALNDKSIAGLIAATGGIGSAQLLPYLPYQKWAESRKLFMGYSDSTALNLALLRCANMVNFNGPSAAVRVEPEEDRQYDSESLADALDLLLTCEPWADRSFIRQRYTPRCVTSGRVRGLAVGGNLTTLACLLGTPYIPSFTNSILFLEDVDEGGYELDRTLTHLRLAGVFKEAAGIVFGEFTRAPKEVEPADPSIEEVVYTHFKDGPPCLYGCGFSHGDYTAVLPIGVEAELDADAGIVSFAAPLVRE